MKSERNWGRLGMKYKLKDICFYATGKIDVNILKGTDYISTENMLPNKEGVTTASSLPKTAQTRAYQKGDVLVSNIRPYFKKIWFADCDGGCSNDVLVLRAKENINAKFLYYVLADDAFFNYSTATSKGTKMPRGDKTAIMQYEVPNFDLLTQKKIAAILSNIDEKIELNNRINDNLEPHLCVARIAATQLRQTSKTDGCLHTDDKVSGRGGNEKILQVFSSRRAA